MPSAPSIADDLTPPVALPEGSHWADIARFRVLHRVIRLDHENLASDNAVGLWTGISEVSLGDFVKASASQARGRRIERGKSNRWVIGTFVPNQSGIATNKPEGMVAKVPSHLDRVLGHNTSEHGATSVRYLLPTQDLPITGLGYARSKQAQTVHNVESGAFDQNANPPATVSLSVDRSGNSTLAETLMQELARDEWDFRTIGSLSEALQRSPEDVHLTLRERPDLFRTALGPDRHGRTVFTLSSRAVSGRELVAAVRSFLGFLVNR